MHQDIVEFQTSSHDPHVKIIFPPWALDCVEKVIRKNYTVGDRTDYETAVADIKRLVVTAVGCCKASKPTESSPYMVRTTSESSVAVTAASAQTLGESIKYRLRFQFKSDDAQEAGDDWSQEQGPSIQRTFSLESGT